MVVGGRKFPTNAVTFTVNGGDLGNLPDGIELTAAENKENIKVNDTIQYTANLKWNAEENSADKEQRSDNGRFMMPRPELRLQAQQD